MFKFFFKHLGHTLHHPGVLWMVPLGSQSFDRFAVCQDGGGGGGERVLVKDRKSLSSNVRPSARGWNVHKASLSRMPYGMVNVTKYCSRNSSLNLGMH